MVGALVRDDAQREAPHRFVDLDAPCVAPGPPYGVRAGTCEPDAFQALVTELAPDRVQAETWDGRRFGGRSLHFHADTLHLDRALAPLASLRRIELIDEPGVSTVARRLAIPAATAAAVGGLLGLWDGLDGAGQGASVGAGVGLALGLTVATAPSARPFEVIGWAEAPRLGNRLDVAGDGCTSGANAPAPFLAPRCRSLADMQRQADADWVRRIELVLRGGGRLDGTDLVLNDASARLDGRRVPYEHVDRIELRHPRPPLYAAARAADGALGGFVLGSAVGLGRTVAGGEPGVVVRTAVGGAVVGGVGALVVGLIRPRDAVRDVTRLPEP